MNRAQHIERLRHGAFDVLVIGGGITGAGVALDAANRGMCVALVEKRDFASGTSSRSSKLIHGGVRYLKQMQFGVTFEAIQEREVLLRMAPHLVKPLRFILPYRRSLVSSLVYAAGLTLYDRLASSSASRRHRRIENLADEMPMLDRSGIGGAFSYFDARADDCRLVMHVVKKAVQLGAAAANYVAVTGFGRDGAQHLAGVEALDGITGESFSIAAKRVVNAAGVWSDDVRKRFDASRPDLLRPSKGVHLVIDRERLPIDDAVAIPETASGHHLFLLPWENRTVVGTTDTLFSGDIDHPRATADDVRVLLDGLEEYFPAARITAADLTSVYSGLRPLLVRPGSDGAPDKAARDYVIEDRDGLLTVTGGKLTTFRRMAARVVDRIAPSTHCTTDRLDLFSSTVPPASLPADVAEHLHAAFGSDAAAIAANSNACERLDERAPHTIAEIDFVIRNEMAMTVADVLMRRTRLAYIVRDNARSVIPFVAAQLAATHGWNDDQRAKALTEVDRELSELEVDSD
jgi:glycerol-3-phosphate dehydrogenase